MLKWKIDKWEARTDVCFFVGYPRATKGGLFYYPTNQNVIVSTNARFLEEDFVASYKPRSRLALEELMGDMPIQAPNIHIVEQEVLCVTS